MKPKIDNVACTKCTKPLFALRRDKKGRTFFESYGMQVRVDPSTPSTLYAICGACGTETPFPRSYMPS